MLTPAQNRARRDLSPIRSPFTPESYFFQLSVFFLPCAICPPQVRRCCPQVWRSGSTNPWVRDNPVTPQHKSAAITAASRSEVFRNDHPWRGGSPPVGWSGETNELST